MFANNKHNPFTIVRNWYKKIEFIENQIKTLENIKGVPLISISVFLLKAQYIEFKLKRLITSIDQHIYFSNSSPIIKTVVRSPSDLEKREIKMFGQIKIELERYKSPLLTDVKEYISDINNKRKKFAHGLFDSYSTVQQLDHMATQGVKLANKTIKEIDKIERTLDKYDSLDRV